MLSLLFVIVFAILVQYVDGNQRIVYVSELAGSHNKSDCCVYGNCTCNSLDYALANLTSNVLINITTPHLLK